VQGEGGGVVTVPLGLEEFARPEGFYDPLHGRKGEVTEPRKVVVAYFRDEMIRFVPQAEVDALFWGREIGHHPGHELRQLTVVHSLLLAQLTKYSERAGKEPACAAL
jgi:hypothetical protein